MIANPMDYKKLSDNLNLLMANARLNANELARRTGIPASSIKKIRNNDNPNPTLTTLVPLANFFSTTVSQLIGDVPLKVESNRIIDPSQQSQQSVPVITWKDAATWPTITNIEQTFVLSERQYSKNTFGLIVEENTRDRFIKGTLLLIDCEAPVQGQDYVIVIKDNQTIPSIKQILIEDDQIYLKSLQVENLIIPKSSEYKILGTIIEYRNYLK
jgi:SOS-response transcriptional repressor LexA